MSRTISLVCATMFLAAAAPAFAQNRPAVSERVYVGDLDLYSQKGADEALNRVDDAAAGLCADRSRPVPPTERRNVAECEVVAADNAVRDFDHPMVSARHDGLDPQVVIEAEGSADPYANPKG